MAKSAKSTGSVKASKHLRRPKQSQPRKLLLPRPPPSLQQRPLRSPQQRHLQRLQPRLLQLRLLPLRQLHRKLLQSPLQRLPSPQQRLQLPRLLQSLPPRKLLHPRLPQSLLPKLLQSLPPKPPPSPQRKLLRSLPPRLLQSPQRRQRRSLPRASDHEVIGTYACERLGAHMDLMAPAPLGRGAAPRQQLFISGKQKRRPSGRRFFWCGTMPRVAVRSAQRRSIRPAA